jgi:uncharacterized protein (TIGR01244 family)
MPLPIQQHTPDFATAAQLSPADMAAVAALGFKTVVCNRPDFEYGAGQPETADIEAAAAAAGLNYIFLPVIPGQITEAQATRMADIVKTEATPLLAFCRTGTRSLNLRQLAQQFM